VTADFLQLIRLDINNSILKSYLGLLQTDWTCGRSNKMTDQVPPQNSQSQEPPKEPQFPPGWKKKMIPNHLRPTKYSSTSSLFLDSTISKPKNAELVRCIAEWFHGGIKSSLECTPEQKKQFEVFDETLHPLVAKVVDPPPPDIELIEKYVKNIFKIGQLAPESLIMGVAYVERVMNNSEFHLFPFNWKRIMLASLILASKVWEDQAVWNVDFLELFPLATPNDLGQLEKKILSLLGFDVSLKASDYARIYFNLRAQSQATEEHFVELKPLDKDGEGKLEVKTSNYSAKHTKKLYRSSGIVEDITTKVKSPRAVIN